MKIKFTNGSEINSIHISEDNKRGKRASIKPYCDQFEMDMVQVLKEKIKNKQTIICPQCDRPVDYDPYFSTYFCRQCGWIKD
jgi:uncharacterized CHY-type Zn-finger protein